MTAEQRGVCACRLRGVDNAKKTGLPTTTHGLVGGGKGGGAGSFVLTKRGRDWGAHGGACGLGRGVRGHCRVVSVGGGGTTLTISSEAHLPAAFHGLRTAFRSAAVVHAAMSSLRRFRRRSSVGTNTGATFDDRIRIVGGHCDDSWGRWV